VTKRRKRKPLRVEVTYLKALARMAAADILAEESSFLPPGGSQPPLASV